MLRVVVVLPALLPAPEVDVAVGPPELLPPEEVVEPEPPVAEAENAEQRASPALWAAPKSAAWQERIRQGAAVAPIAFLEGPHWQPTSPGGQPTAPMAEEMQAVCGKWVSRGSERTLRRWIQGLV